MKTFECVVNDATLRPSRVLLHHADRWLLLESQRRLLARIDFSAQTLFRSHRHLGISHYHFLCRYRNLLFRFSLLIDMQGNLFFLRRLFLFVLPFFFLDSPPRQRER